MINNDRLFDLEFHNKCRIKIIGVGKGGINAVAGMQFQIKEVELWAIDTDLEVIKRSPIPNSILLVEDRTKWSAKIAPVLRYADLVFIVAGMGGEHSIDLVMEIARMAKELDALTIGVVTRPFSFEGIERANRAKLGIERLVSQVDTLITVSNDRLLPEEKNDLSHTDAFKLADRILKRTVRAIPDGLFSGLSGLDFADMRTTFADAGLASVGWGEGEGEFRAQAAAMMARSAPTLEGAIEESMRIYLLIGGGSDLTYKDINDATEIFWEVIDPNAYCHHLAQMDRNRNGKISVLTIVIAGDRMSKSLVSE